MDLTKEELRIYIGTLGGILKMIKEMESPSVKKIRDLLETDLHAVRTAFDKKIEVH